MKNERTLTTRLWACIALEKYNLLYVYCLRKEKKKQGKNSFQLKKKKKEHEIDISRYHRYIVPLSINYYEYIDHLSYLKDNGPRCCPQRVSTDHRRPHDFTIGKKKSNLKEISILQNVILAHCVHSYNKIKRVEFISSLRRVLTHRIVIDVIKGIKKFSLSKRIKCFSCKRYASKYILFW